MLFAKNLSLLMELSLLRTVQDDRVLFRDLLCLFKRNERNFSFDMSLREMLFLATYCIICRGTEDALLKNQRRAQRLLEEIHAMKVRTYYMGVCICACPRLLSACTLWVCRG